MVWNTFKCWVIEIVNTFFFGLMGWFVDMLIFFIEFLPPSPFQFEPIQWGAFGDAVGYFVPVATMLEHLAYILLAVTIWYSVQHVLRFLKMVR